MNPDQPNSRKLSDIRLGVLVVTIVGIVFSAFGLFLDTSHFFRVYLVGWLLWAQVAVGCLGIVLLNSLVNGRWLYTVLRYAEAGARTIPLVGLLFVPILFNMEAIYDWTTSSSLSAGQEVYLTTSFFILRNFLYFLIWSVLGYYLSGWSYRRDEENPSGYDDRARALAALGMVLYVATTTMAAFDWTMSIDYKWISTSYGWIELARMAISTMPLLFLIAAYHWDRPEVAEVTTKKVVGDYAALLLVCTLAWLYLNGISFIVIWSGNVSYYVAWFVERFNEGWIGYSTFLTVAHMVILAFLLIPRFKGQRSAMVSLAFALFALRTVEIYWLVMPHLEEAYAPWYWDIAPALMIGGLWFLVFTWFVEQKPLLPKYHVSNNEHGAHHDYSAAQRLAD